METTGGGGLYNIVLAHNFIIRDNKMLLIDLFDLLHILDFTSVGLFCFIHFKDYIDNF